MLNLLEPKGRLEKIIFILINDGYLEYWNVIIMAILMIHVCFILIFIIKVINIIIMRFVEIQGKLRLTNNNFLICLISFINRKK